MNNLNSEFQHQTEENVEIEGIGEDNFQDPDFNIEMQDEVPPMVRFNLNLSPGNYFNNPLNNYNILNSFNYFSSPNTPKSMGSDFSTVQSFLINSSSLDDAQALLKQEIELNLTNKEEKKVSIVTAANSISSPRSAFRYYS